MDTKTRLKSIAAMKLTLRVATKAIRRAQDRKRLLKIEDCDRGGCIFEGCSRCKCIACLEDCV